MGDLKIYPQYFVEVVNGNKTFEIRKNDRNYQLAEIIRLREYDHTADAYTGRCQNVVITYISNYQQKKGFVVFGIKLVGRMYMDLEEQPHQ